MEVQGHSFKPKPRFFGKDKYYFGLELEVEAPNQEIMRQGLHLLDNPVYCYAKRDGSLGDYGWELVTHPIASKSWLTHKRITSAGAFFGYVQKLRELGYSSHVGGRCGLHIHVSLSAFTGLNLEHHHRRCTHLYWFMRIVNSDLFKKLSQRQEDTINRWARIRNVNARNFSSPEREGGESRYTATNMTSHTCEVRVFRGNMREDRIRKAVESVAAALEFSRNLTSKDFKAAVELKDPILPLRNFIKYVDFNSKLYPNLRAFLVEIGQLQEKKEGNS